MKNKNSYKKKLLIFEIVGFIFNSLAAAGLHFLFEASGKELFTALFASVNESVWEHIKIFTVPYVVWAFIEIFCLKIPFRRFVCSKVFGLYSMVILIPAFFYTYTGIFGRNIAAVDIISGFLITLLAYYISFGLITKAPFIERYYTLCLILFAIYCVCTSFFTFAPPKINLFRDPITGTSGIPQ